MDIESSILKRKNLIFIIIIVIIFGLFVANVLENRSLSSKVGTLNYEIHNWEDRYLHFADSYSLKINNNISITDVDENLSNLDDLLKKEERTIIFRYNETLAFRYKSNIFN